MKNDKEKIFIGIYEVAGYFQNLFLGLDSLGFDVGYLNLSTNKFEYNNYIKKNYKILNYANKQNKNKDSGLKYLYPFRFVYLLSIRFIVFIWCLNKFDVFIFSSGKSFFNFYDCKLIKLLSKKIIFISLGSDSRPAFLNGKYKDDYFQGKFNSRKCFLENKKIENNIRKVEKYATWIINYPQHGHFHAKKFISGNFIGFPTNQIQQVNNSHDCTSSNPNKRVKIIHAPSRPLAKGSLEFKKIIKSLIEEGHNIEYIELVGKTNSEVLDQIKSCDIVLDELYSDTPLGGLGTEAALYSKPVIVFGYFSKESAFLNNLEKYPPSFYSDPLEAKNIIKKLVENRKLREDSGKKLNKFILDNWNTKEVAKRYIQILSENFPEYWNIEPLNISYLYGWGLSKDELKSNIQTLIEDFGIESLQLGHNQKLTNSYLKLIYIND
jgi:hypothetical protein